MSVPRVLGKKGRGRANMDPHNLRPVLLKPRQILGASVKLTECYSMSYLYNPHPAYLTGAYMMVKLGKRYGKELSVNVKQIIIILIVYR